MNEEHLYSLFLCVLFFLDTQPGQNTNSYYWSSFVEVCCEPPHHPTIYTYINICRSVPKPTHPSSVVDRATEWVQCGAGPFAEPCFGLMIGEVNASGDGRKDYQMDKPNQPPPSLPPSTTGKEMAIMFSRVFAEHSCRNRQRSRWEIVWRDMGEEFM